MAKKIINIGVEGNDGTGDSIRESFRKVNENFTELYAIFGVDGTLALSTLDGITVPPVDESDNQNVYGKEKILITNPEGTSVVFKDIVGDGNIEIDNNDADELIIRSVRNSLDSESRPKLGTGLNANTFPIGNMAPPSQSGAEFLTLVHGIPVTEDSMAVNKGYADGRYVNVSGDTMTGPLYAHDHPGAFAGVVSPNGVEDLRFATKYYVDNASYASSVNLFVSTTGDDLQRLTPAGKEGRALAYSYRTLNAACREAERIINETPLEPGPYRQRITYNDGATASTVVTSTIGSGTAGSTRVRFTNFSGISVDQGKDSNNIDILPGKILRGLTSGATAKIVRYYGDVGSGQDQIDVELLKKTTDITFFGTGYVNAQTLLTNNIEFIVAETLGRVQQIIPRPTLSSAQREVDLRKILSAIIEDITVGGNKQSIENALDFFRNPTGLESITTHLRDTLNGIAYLKIILLDVIANEDPAVRYQLGIDQVKITRLVAEERADDTITLLLNTIQSIFEDGIDEGGATLNFLPGEEIEYGNPVRETQITIFVESGIYYEDFPIRVPANCSIKGDEFRRSIIRPKPGKSQSKWARIFFRRDPQIDGLNVTPTAFGYHYLVDPTDPDSDTKNNDQMDLFLMNDATILRNITCQGHGGFMMVLDPEGQILTKSPYCQTATSFSKSLGKQAFAGGQFIDGFTGNQRITFTEKLSDTEFVVSGIRREIQLPCSFVINDQRYTINSLTDNDTSKDAAISLIRRNRTFIRAEVIGYLNDTYPDLDYNSDTCSRDVGLILDSIVYDLTYGGISRSVDAGKKYFTNSSGIFAVTNQLTETVAGINYINTLVQDIIVNQTIETLYQDDYNQVKDVTLTDGALAASNITSCISAITNILNNGNVLFGLKRLAKLNKEFIKAEVIAYINTNFPPEDYDEAKCERDIGYIIDAVLWDMIFDSNFRSRKAGEAYLRSYAVEVLTEPQRTNTIQALEFLKEELLTRVSENPTAYDRIEANMDLIISIITEGVSPTPSLDSSAPFRIPNPTGYDSGYENARDLILANTEFITAEVIQYITDTYPSLTYDQAKCQRDVDYILEAISYDLTYGGNSQTVSAGLAYYEGNSLQLGSGEKAPTLAAYLFMKDLVGDVAQGIAVTPINTASVSQIIDSTVGSLAAATEAENLVQVVRTIINNKSSTPTVVEPSTAWADGVLVAAKSSLTAATPVIQEAVIDYINSELLFNYNEETCARDVGYIVDALCDDFFGGYVRSFEAGYSYFANASALKAITEQAGPTISAIEYIGTIFKRIIRNLEPTTVYQTVVEQVIDPSLTGGNTVQTIIDEGIRIITTIISGDSTDAGQMLPAYKISLDPATPLLTFPRRAELTTAGNKSMLANDFTQINDLGYGIFATNNGLSEQVSTFTYYCYTAFYALNGAQIRSLNGSSANGTYGLRAAGADPSEIPDFVTLADNMVQTAKIYKTGDFEDTGLIETLSFYIDDYDYAPYNVSEVEIYHGEEIGYSRYQIANVVDSEVVSPRTGLRLLKVNIATSGEGETSQSGLQADLIDNQWIEIRVLQNIRFDQLEDIAPTRPSTALIYTDDPYQTYRTIAFGNTDAIGNVLSDDITDSIATLDTASTTTRFVTVNFASGVTASDLDIEIGSSLIIAGASRPRLNGIWSVYDVDYTGTFCVIELTLSVNIGDEPLEVGQTVKRIAVDQSVLGMDTSFDYVKIVVKKSDIGIGDPEVGDSSLTLGSNAGDLRIAVETITNEQEIARINSGRFIFGWKGKLHRILSYTEPFDSTTAYISIDPADIQNKNDSGPASGLQEGFDPSEDITLTIRGGLRRGARAEITVRISTMRATGHDFLDIGTGSYNSTNFPSNIYGDPALTPDEDREVVEEGKGRVFWVSTDQDGIFKVGRFFKVDQGTGTVTFSAAIALSNLDGIGFKRGVVVTEFSADDTFADSASDAVPTEAATRSYIDRRLGLGGTGSSTLMGGLKIGPGFLDLSGSQAMTGPIVTSGAPTSELHAANKEYVDFYTTFENLSQVELTDLATNEIVAWNGTDWVNKKLTNSNVASDAAIDQNKLNLNIARAKGSDVVITSITKGNPTIINALNHGFTGGEPIKIVEAGVVTEINGNWNVTYIDADSFTIPVDTSGNPGAYTPSSGKVVYLGVSSYNSEYFTVSSTGFVSLRSSSIDLTRIEPISNKSILANFTGSNTTPREVTPSRVFREGMADLFNVTNNRGVPTITAATTGGDVSTYSFELTPVATGGAADTLVKRDGDGKINSTGIKLYNKEIANLTSSLTELKLYAPDNTDWFLRAEKEADPLVTPTTRVTLWGTYRLASGSTLHASYADLAEYYEADQEYEAGTVVIFGGDKEVTVTSLSKDSRVAGVISTQAAYVMNEDCPGLKVAVALQGRVPCKVIGSVKKGDLLCTSNVPGYATKAIDPTVGTIIGKAMQNKETFDPGVVEVAVGRS